MPKITVKNLNEDTVLVNLTKPEDLSQAMINLTGQRQLSEAEKNIMLQSLEAKLGIEEYNDDFVMLDENGEEIVEYATKSASQNDGCLDGGLLIPLSSSSLAGSIDLTSRLPTILEGNEEDEDCEQGNVCGL